MQNHFLAIDQGSQSTKVTIFDERGQPLVRAQRPLRPYDNSTTGQAVHPDDDLWDSLVGACQEVFAHYTGSPGDIAGVGLCTIRFCRALLDADGYLTEPVLSWMDDRAHLPFRQTNPRTRWVTTSSGYIGHRLTGRFVDAAANYQGLWPIDPVTATWSSDPKPYVSAGMPRRMLFELASPGEAIGPISAEAARETRIPAGLPVFATANDKAVEALGAGLRSESTVLLSLGTYIAAMTVGATAHTDHDAYWVNFAAEPGRYLYESNGIRRGMWTVSWFRSLLEDSAGDLEELLNAEAVAVPPGSNGLLTILDWLAPGRAPYRRGALLGFDGSQGRAHIYRSILEGIALTMLNHTSAMETALKRDFDAVLVSGGGSRSDVMMQIVADVFNRPANRLAVTDTAGLGAAISVAVGTGFYSHWEGAVDSMTKVADTFQPRCAAARIYAEINDIYADLARFTDPLFRRMAHLVSDAPRAR